MVVMADSDGGGGFLFQFVGLAMGFSVGSGRRRERHTIGWVSVKDCGGCCG